MDEAAPAHPPAHPAATVIVARDGEGGMEVLLLRRSDVGAFAGLWVFPGGRVDAADPGDDEMHQARSAAVREAAEEVGLAVRPESLLAFSHWTPPPITPKRFATWFFVAPWGGDDVVVDGHEIVDHRWLRPADAIVSGLPLAPPTWVTLHHLDEYPSLAALSAAAPTRTIERYLTRPARAGDVPVLLWHGDAAYDSGDPDQPGPRHRLWMADGAWRYERTAG
jgi:8-oxo-dGTP pyrophosphatase MutT (NUDIX family)